MGFDQALQYEIPYMHALAVHFPLVILLLAAGAAAGYAVRGTAAWRAAVLVLLVLGAASAYWAQRTGHTLYADVEGEPAVERFVAFHEQVGTWTVWASALALVVTVGASLWWRRRQKLRVTSDPGGVRLKEPLGLRLLVFVSTGAAAVLVAYTGHLGALMVWGVPK